MGEAKEEIREKKGKAHTGKKSMQVILREINAHHQTFREDFSYTKYVAWKDKLTILINELWKLKDVYPYSERYP